MSHRAEPSLWVCTAAHRGACKNQRPDGRLHIPVRRLRRRRAQCSRHAGTAVLEQALRKPAAREEGLRTVNIPSPCVRGDDPCHRLLSGSQIEAAQEGGSADDDASVAEGHLHECGPAWTVRPTRNRDIV